MNPLPEPVEKYLKKYSTGNWKLESRFKNKFDNVIVVPVIAEYNNLRKLLTSLLKNDNKHFKRTAIIIVVNNLPDSSDEVKNDNSETLIFLKTLRSNPNRDEALACNLANPT